MNSNNCNYNGKYTDHNEYYQNKDKNYVHLLSKHICEDEMPIYNDNKYILLNRMIRKSLKRNVSGIYTGIMKLKINSLHIKQKKDQKLG